MSKQYIPTTDDGYVSPEMKDFMEACHRVREAMESISPAAFLRRDPKHVSAFATRMAAAGYRALAAELEAVAREADTVV